MFTHTHITVYHYYNNIPILRKEADVSKQCCVERVTGKHVS